MYKKKTMLTFMALMVMKGLSNSIDPNPNFPTARLIRLKNNSMDESNSIVCFIELHFSDLLA